MQPTFYSNYKGEFLYPYSLPKECWGTSELKPHILSHLLGPTLIAYNTNKIYATNPKINTVYIR